MKEIDFEQHLRRQMRSDISDGGNDMSKDMNAGENRFFKNIFLRRGKMNRKIVS